MIRYEPARRRAVECARELASGCATVEHLKARMPTLTDIHIRTSLTYLRTHGYIRRVQEGKGRYRAIYELTVPLSEIEETILPKPDAPVQFDALEAAMGLPASVSALLSSHPSARYVVQMGVNEK